MMFVFNSTYNKLKGEFEKLLKEHTALKTRHENLLDSLVKDKVKPKTPIKETVEETNNRKYRRTRDVSDDELIRAAVTNVNVSNALRNVGMCVSGENTKRVRTLMNNHGLSFRPKNDDNQIVML